jgi:4'-phosphopantetheinyl transferase
LKHYWQMGADIQVFYYSGAYTRTLLPQSSALLARLPVERRDRLARRVRLEQRASDLAALRLLEVAMASLGYADFRLADIDYGTGASVKPRWRVGQADFSMTHTASAVACAISARGRVGLDMEERRPIDPAVVNRLLADTSALRDGLSEVNAVERWTQIEAVVKGAGVGVTRAREILWAGATAELQGTRWWVHRVDCGPSHSAHAAIDIEGAIVTVTRVDEL